ncbi:hypothetical protein H9P43_007015 [Blastocladiella emersonii ATCC 22665]|nr:hypothetical protein H9P43_007015 [Blastocladiella emersonii ATCC 22665]
MRPASAPTPRTAGTAAAAPAPSAKHPAAAATTPTKPPLPSSRSGPSWLDLAAHLRKLRSTVYAELAALPAVHSVHFASSAATSGTSNPPPLVYVSPRRPLADSGVDQQLWLARTDDTIAEPRPLLLGHEWAARLRRARFAPVSPLAAAWRRSGLERQRRSLHQCTIDLLHVSAHDAAALLVVFVVRSTLFVAHVDPADPTAHAHCLAQVHLMGIYDPQIVRAVDPATGRPRLACFYLDACSHGQLHLLELDLTFASRPVALPDYNAQEEFARHTGYWPSLTARRVLFTAVDDTHVPLFAIANDVHVRYPRAGLPNPTTSLHLCHVPSRTATALADVDAMLDQVAPWREYLTRAGWIDDDTAWVQVLSRNQRRMAVVALHLAGTNAALTVVWEEESATKWIPIHSLIAFVPTPDASLALVIASERAGFMELYHATAVPGSPAPRPPPTRLTHGPSFAVSRWDPLAVHHETGTVFFHARRRVGPASPLFETCLCSVDLTSPGTVHAWTPDGWDARAVLSGCGTAAVVTLSHLRHPPVVVGTSLLPTRDAAAGRIAAALVGAADDPPRGLLDHCSGSVPATLSLVRPQHFHLTSPASGLPVQGFLWLPTTTTSSETPLPTVVIAYAGPDVASVHADWYAGRAGGAVVRALALLELGFAVVMVDGRGAAHPQLGAEFEAAIARPDAPMVVAATVSGTSAGEDGAAAAAVVSDTSSSGAAGPRALQTVPAATEERVGGRHTALRARTRSQSRGRGTRSNDPAPLPAANTTTVTTALGDGELADQVAALRYLFAQGVPLDPARVAITGWSFGGFVALMALAKYPDVFRVAVAGAPVTCWTQYDSAYAERFLGDPHANAAAYTASSVLTYVPRLPKEPNRLFLVHGQLDDNVHLARHTQPLVDALVRHGVPHALQVYPSERHGLRQAPSIEHFETQYLWWLTQHL